MTEKQQPRKTKRPMSAREMAAKFNVSERSVRKWWSQSRADYLAENSISRNKPWEYFGISRMTWYRRGKPNHPLRINMKYLIKSTKGYWLEKGHGYTQSQNEAYAFTLEEMLHLGFNLDGCTLLKQS